MSSGGGSVFESKKFKTIMKFVYGWGGAVVIVGAMFKIQHWPGATIMLIGGLGIEACIFILSAFEPLHEDPNWELAYPELALGHSDDLDHDAEPVVSSRRGGAVQQVHVSGVTEHLDEMLSAANIDAALLDRLGDKFERFLHQDGSHSYYKFSNKNILSYFYSNELNKNVLTLSSGGVNTTIDDESEIIKTILSHFKDNVDVIREFKLKTIGL